MRETASCDSCEEESTTMGSNGRQGGHSLWSAGFTCERRSRLGQGSQWGHVVTVLIFTMVLNLSCALMDDSCHTGELLTGYVPSDEQPLNTYIPHPSVNSMQDCVAQCCLTPSCDLAWMVDGSCFSVHCIAASTCQPKHSSKYPESLLVAVTQYTVSSSSVQTTQPEGRYSICYTDIDCDDNQFCFGLDKYEEGICAPDALRSVESVSAVTTLRPTTHTSQHIQQTSHPVLQTSHPAQQTSHSTQQTSHHVQQTSHSTQQTSHPAKQTTLARSEGQGGMTSPPLTVSHVEMPEKKDESHPVNPVNGTDSSDSEDAATNTSNGNQGPPPVLPATNATPLSSATPPGPGSAPSLHDPTPSLPAAATVLPSTSPTSAAVVSVAMPPFVQLTVSLGNSKTLQLPEEQSVSLNAFVIPSHPPGGRPYSYEYQVVSKPAGSTLQMTSTGQEDPQVQFSHLTAGFYQFKVVVSGERSSGSAQVNVTVLAPPRVNKPPVAIIQPAMQMVTLPNSDTILDGSGSTDDDDDRITSYSWEQVQGPIGDHEISGDKDTLQLTDLKPGVYLIRLTVTDYDGASNSTIANVTVKKEEDYKPQANAGPDVEIKLPVNFATLNGSKSTDDHGIVSYEWTTMTEQVSDMTGSSSRILHLTNLEEGTYVFKLTVIDRSGQKDSDTATIIVKPEQNLAPTAAAGPDKELSLPSDSTELDGSGSVDDQGIVGYQWEQVSGPSTAVLTSADQARVTIAGLQEGPYVFSLTVTDAAGETSSDQVSVIVKGEAKNQPPVARAGPDQTISLPTSWVELDGTGSSDDRGIESYHWTRSKESPAAGLLMGGSDHEAVLRVVDLVPGRYSFTLNVTDAKGKHGTDTATVTVLEDPNLKSLVQIVFLEDIKAFTQQDKKDLVMPLAVLLGVKNDDVIIQRISQTDTNMLTVVFLARNKTSGQPLPGPEVLRRLKTKGIQSQEALLSYQVLQYDTLVCQKNCSGHGQCDEASKRCVCETFWMQNPFRLKFGDGESNCDWSILYVIIVCFLILVAMGMFIWLIVCCCVRRKKKGKRRHRYTLLEDRDTEVIEMLPKMGNGKQSSSIMMSESGEDSDDEHTVFDVKRQDRNGSKPANGFLSGKHRSSRTPHRTDKL